MPAVTSPSAIALDASLWDEPVTGIALYAKMLASELQAQDVQVARLGARSSGEVPRGTSGSTTFVIGRLPQVLAQRPEPLFHAVGNFNLPLVRVAGKKLVLTVHDLIPEILPETVSTAFRWQFRCWLTRSLRIADQVICVSEQTKRDLLARYEVDPERVCVIHHGVDHVLKIAPPEGLENAFTQALGLPEQYVLYAGSLDARKNVGLLLDAIEHLKTPPCVVLVGQSWFGSEAVEKRIALMRANHRFDIRPLGYQSEAVFYELIRRASVLVFPSRYEGFGLPPLEAMRLGVPTLVSDAGSLPEVCGPGCRVAPLGKPEAWANVISDILASAEERHRLHASGISHASQFSWHKTATLTLAAYRRAMGGQA